MANLFFCCGVSTFTTQAFTSLYKTGSLGSFSRAVFNIDQAINSQLTMFLPTLGVGVIGGLFAALFTWANLKICKWRNRNIVPRAWARIMEPVIVAFITTTLAVLIPYLFECMPSRCKEDGSLPGCTARYASSSVMKEEDLVQYTCQKDGFYNPAASLFFTTGDKTIEHLLSRNTHYMFDYGALVTLFIVGNQRILRWIKAHLSTPPAQGRLSGKNKTQQHTEPSPFLSTDTYFCFFLIFIVILITIHTYILSPT